MAEFLEGEESVVVSKPVEARGRLVHLQILRAVAASLVVVDHTIGALIFRKFPLGQYETPSWQVGGLGVYAFFVLSGVIMTMQSGGLSGSLADAGRFLYRRVTRIAPMYWIATGIQLYAMHTWRQMPAHWREELLLSSSFIPDFVGSNEQMRPLLQQGWTLNYEMAFYFLFAVGLLVRPQLRFLVLLGVPYLLLHYGPAFGPATNGTVAAKLLGFYTDRVILLFAIGCILGWLATHLRWLPKVHTAVSPAFLLLLPVLPILTHPAGYPGLDLWSDLKWFGALVVLLCLAPANDRLGWVGRTLVLAGDASYSTYLFHNLALGYLLNYALAWFPLMQHGMRWTALLVLCSIVFSNLVGVAVYLMLERPLMRALKGVRWRQKQEQPMAVLV